MQNHEMIQKLIRIPELEKQLQDNDYSLNCSKCGESECNNPNNCVALLNICKNCSKRGYFTKLCNFICATCGDVEYHRREHCRAVAYSAKCQTCGIQGHFQGTKVCPGKGSYCARKGRRRQPSGIIFTSIYILGLSEIFFCCCQAILLHVSISSYHMPPQTKVI